MAAAMANKTVKNRRDVFKRFVHPNRRTRLDSLLPGNKRLFGGKLDDVCKALKDGGQVKKIIYGRSTFDLTHNVSQLYQSKFFSTPSSRGRGYSFDQRGHSGDWDSDHRPNRGRGFNRGKGNSGKARDGFKSKGFRGKN